MKKNILKLTDDEIDLIEYIKTLLKHKITVLIFSVIGAIVASVYASFFATTLLVADIIIKNPNFEIFKPYTSDSSINSNNVFTIQSEFVSALNDNLLSKNNLNNFKKNYINNSKKKCIDCNYFKFAKDQEIKNRYVLTAHIKVSQAEKYYKEESDQLIDFLDKYIVFTIDKTKKEFKERLYLDLLRTISVNEESSDIIKKIYVTNSSSINRPENSNSEYLFIQLTNLELNIANLKKKTLNILNEKFDYKYIYQEASVFEKKENKKFLIILLGLFSGFIFSCTIVFYRFIKI
jgi:LPS O-antigen subunit length determinant protein (WzzB/FepE family)